MNWRGRQFWSSEEKAVAKGRHRAQARTRVRRAAASLCAGGVGRHRVGGLDEDVAGSRDPARRAWSSPRAEAALLVPGSASSVSTIGGGHGEVDGRSARLDMWNRSLEDDLRVLNQNRFIFAAQTRLWATNMNCYEVMADSPCLRREVGSRRARRLRELIRRRSPAVVASEACLRGLGEPLRAGGRAKSEGVRPGVGVPLQRGPRRGGRGVYGESLARSLRSIACSIHRLEAAELRRHDAVLRRPLRRTVGVVPVVAAA